MLNSSPTIVNTGSLQVLIIKVCHCSVLLFSGSICSIREILVSKEHNLELIPTVLIPICIACKAVFKFLAV